MEFYEGESKNGKADGFGKLKYKNEDYYEGHFVAGLRNGYGKYFLKSG